VKTPSLSTSDSAQTIDRPRKLSATSWLTGRQRRRFAEALLAYAFLIPSILIIGTFGLFPLAFAAYQSTLRGLNRVVGPYDGLGNYVRAMDNLAYVLAFWIAAGLLIYSVYTLIQSHRSHSAAPTRFWIWLLPGSLIGVGFVLMTIFAFRLIPEWLMIPTRLRGQGDTGELFRAMMVESWWLPQVQLPFWGALVAIAVGLGLMTLVERNLRRTGRFTNQTGVFITATVMLTGGAVLGWLTWTEVTTAYTAALESGEGLDIWTQIITISAGFLLLLLAWWVWESASDRTSNISVALRLAAASMIMVGAWVLIAELPRVVAAGDEVWWRSLLATVYYVMGTVPTQLILGLGLAVLLFQKIQGQTFFRVVFFLPFIAPFVGTAAVFRIIFSNRSTGPVNSIMTSLGFDPLLWLNEPTGIIQMLASSTTLSYWLAGPSLALIVIMIFGVWTYTGFGTVIFLAGLGSIPRELYEVSAIDGAGRWSQFRHITLPMLSPTIYFLTLYSVIGTFKAFNHIYVLRQAAALGTSDTASIVIFQAFKRDTRFGYASALAILLLIIILAITVFNNRIASRRVFYG
jgi:ABC-type sugar transport system permease subunit